MNFVIFMPDEMRADTAGCYGHPLVRTPNLDALAADGTRFDACYTQHPVCSPARCSMFTGWYPHVRGHRTLWHLLRPEEPNLLRYLKQAGYDVRWWGKNDLLSTESFADSVDLADSPGGGLHGPLVRSGPEDPHWDSFLAEPFDGGPMETGDGMKVAAAIDYLKNKPDDRPFCIFLPLTVPHPAYGCPEPWHGMYAPDDLPPLRPAELEGKPMFHRLIRQTRQLDRLDEAELRRIAAVYLGMVSYTDHLLGEMLKALTDTGRDDDTAVFFTADHGDWAGEYGLVEKWPSAMDDTITRIPFVARIPDGQGGHVVDTPTELFDIHATMLDLAGIEPQHTDFSRSLVPQLHGQAGDAERAAFCEGGYDPHEPHCFEGRPSLGWVPENIYYQKGALQQSHPASVCRTVMMREQRYKLIYRTADVCELYDLQEDPRELNNLYAEPAVAELRDRLESRLLKWLVTTSDVTPLNEDPRGLPDPPPGSTHA